jgi:glycosyltransferase involved in cell wall biosynthesis
MSDMRPPLSPLSKASSESPISAPRSAGAECVAAKKHTVLVVGARGIPDVEGGAEKGAEATFPLVAERGFRVILIGLAQYIRSASYKGVELRSAPEIRLLKTDKLAYYLRAIGIALKVRPKIVHLQGLGAALFLIAYKALGFRTVVRYGSADYILDKWGVIGRLGFIVSEYQLRFADAVIAVAPALRERLAQRGITKNVHVMANAVDDTEPFDEAEAARSEYGEHLRRPFILAVGRVTAQKNVHNLIAGFHRLLETQQLPHQLLIIGGLDDEAYVRELRGLLSDRVTLLGRLPRRAIGPFYAKCAAYVNASVHEGSSNAVLEAMSWRAPLLLSDIPENRDFGVSDHHYFDPLSADSIGEAMGRSLASPQDYVVPTDRFATWSQVADRTVAIYNEILRAH